VPALWPLEVANALLVGEHRKRITEAKVAQFLALLQILPITVDDETALRAWQDTLHLARLHDLTVYDAAYLELTVRLGLPLASLDDKLKAAAAAAGVTEFRP
jgi:predicted nucleic acid-binding protein